MSLRKVPKGPLRDGFTTGTSATAAAKSALMAIIHQQKIASVKVHLPIDKILEIPVHHCEFTESTANCSVIKDAGDDPDVTNGAEIGCIIKLTQQRDIEFIAGEGKGSYSIADISCWPWVSRFEWQEIDLNSYPNIKDWYIRISNRPAVQKGYSIPKFVTEIPKI